MDKLLLLLSILFTLLSVYVFFYTDSNWIAGLIAAAGVLLLAMSFTELNFAQVQTELQTEKISLNNVRTLVEESVISA